MDIYIFAVNLPSTCHQPANLLLGYGFVVGVMSINEKKMMVSNCLLMCLFIKVFDPFNANFAICIPFFLVAKPNSTLTENPCELVSL